MTLNPNAYGPPVGLATNPSFVPPETMGIGETTSTRNYLLQLLLVGSICGFIAAASLLMGLIGPGLMVIGLIFVGLTLWRVEMGLFVMAALVPWELQTTLSTEFSAIKAAGIAVAMFGLMKVYVSRGTPWPNMMKYALALGIWSTVSEIFNIADPIIPNLLSFAALLSNIAFMYLLMRFCSTPVAFRTLLWVVALGSVSAAAVGLIEYASPSFLAGMKAGRLTTGANTNTYVRYLLPGIFLTPILIAGVRSQLLRMALLPGIIACVVAIVLTGSRGAAIGAAAGGLTMLLFTRRIPLGARVGLAIGLAIVAVGAYYFAAQMGAQTVLQKRTAGADITASSKTRFARWQLAMIMAVENPVLGVGPGVQEGLEYIQKGYGFTESHNDVISSLIRGGIPGAICFVGFLLAGFMGLWRLPPGITRAALLGMWAAFIITGMFNPSLTKKILWLVAGIIAAAVVCYSPRYGKVAEPQAAPEAALGIAPH
jgi:O-antigen ligase